MGFQKIKTHHHSSPEEYLSLTNTQPHKQKSWFADTRFVFDTSLSYPPGVQLLEKGCWLNPSRN